MFLSALDLCYTKHTKCSHLKGSMHIDYLLMVKNVMENKAKNCLFCFMNMAVFSLQNAGLDKSLMYSSARPNKQTSN